MKNYKQEIDELRAVERKGSFEYSLQVTLVGTAVALGWMLLGYWPLLAWFAVTYGLSAYEKYLHRRVPQPYSYRLYVWYLTVGTAIAVSATFLPLYLWTLGEPIYHFAAMVYVVGAVLNTFVLRAKAWPSLICYAVPNGLGMIGIAVMFTAEYGLSATSLVALLLAVYITIYLVVMVFESIRRVKLARRTTQELLQAQKAETLANFAGGVAHDFNNLLSVVSATIEQARNEDDPAERGRLCGQALAAVERGAGLTRQLLTVGRQSALSSERIAFPRFANDLRDFLLRIVPSYIKVEVSCDPRLKTIESEPSLLQSMLINLAMNSREAMSDGGKLRIDIEAVTIEEPTDCMSGSLEAGWHASFTVRDTGEGISPDVFGRVLEPFFTTRPVGEGTGLGLAMVAGFVQQVGGALNIRSEAGAGTTVQFYLPLNQGWDIETEAPPLTTSQTSPAEAGTRILLVEDDDALRLAIARYLLRLGYLVLACENGDIAYDAVGEGYVPDIVLTDIVMHGTIQGTELVDLLRPKVPGAKFILMTGYAFNHKVGDAESGEAGGPAYLELAKPFKLADLGKMLGGEAAPETSAPPANQFATYAE